MKHALNLILILGLGGVGCGASDAPFQDFSDSTQNESLNNPSSSDESLLPGADNGDSITDETSVDMGALCSEFLLESRQGTRLCLERLVAEQAIEVPGIGFYEAIALLESLGSSNAVATYVVAANAEALLGISGVDISTAEWTQACGDAGGTAGIDQNSGLYCQMENADGNAWCRSYYDDDEGGDPLFCGFN